MKPRITPTSTEQSLKEGDFIVSKTDTKGRILYANRTFIALSRYSEAELLGAQHNIIRHPDMPRAAFKLLWDYIGTGQEFIGYVKNMAKDGSFYWVKATVTPDFDDTRTITGYTSVRRKPKNETIGIVSGLYREMLAAEARAGTRDAIDAGNEVLQRALNGQDYARFILAL